MARPVVVTGSTSGIGLGIAKGFAAAGDTVVINGFGEKDAIEAACRMLDEAGAATVLYHPADMTRPGEIEDLIRSTAKTFGTVDVLVNNAGIQHVAKIEDFPPENGTS
jgi:3-hydroxybutyrate dehydrogenase